jgi:uncharacterized protein YwqG
MDPHEILSALSNVGLSRIQADVLKLLQESIRLTAHPLANTSTPPGVSRLGGVPDLPAGVAWPAWKNLPMSFIAQVNLADLANFAPAQNLPKSGLLSFFYDAAQETYGADPTDRGGWQVLYFAASLTVPQKEEGFHLFAHTDPLQLKPAPFPAGLAAGARYKPCQLTFASEYTLPGAPSQYLPNLGWSPNEIERYEQFQAGFPSGGDRKIQHFRMFGCPDQIQDDMQLQCALYANGVSPDDAADPKVVAQAASRKTGWQLLLQVDSDETIGMRWASSGMLYFWLEKAALQQRQFDRSWLVLQSE